MNKDKLGPVEIRQLEASDAGAFREIRLASLQRAPDAFSSTYEAEVMRPIAAFEERLKTSAIFGAYAGAEIIGMIGFRQEIGARDCHKGFFSGTYVQPEAWGCGVGSALVKQGVDYAGQFVEQVTLGVVHGNDAAIGLYRKFGFETYGIEPKALKIPSGYLD